MLGRDLAVTRAVYLFDLAAVCSVTPPMVGDLTVADFGRLIAGIRARHAAAARAEAR